MNSVGGYAFKNESLLKRALTHSSYSKDNYERFEFLGDSILDFLVAKHFFMSCDDSEGVLTKKRSHFVSEEYLSIVFDKILRSKDILFGKSCDKITNSMKCDIVEAVIGAIFLDSDLEECEKFISRNFDFDSENIELNDYKTRLQEFAQSKKLNVEYVFVEMQGKPHDPNFIMECRCDGIVARKSGKTKQQAQQECAKTVLESLRGRDK